MTRPVVGKLTVPYMVDAARQPIDFKVLDSSHVEKCAKHRRCGICGRRINHGRLVAFIGPADDRSCFADPWMHPACAELAMAQCPFLRGSRDWRDPSARVDPFTARYSAGMVLYHARDSRSHRDQFGHWHFEAIGVVERVG